MKKCIVAFDKQVILELLEKMLINMGFEVVLFHDGEEAFDYFKNNKTEISLIIASYSLSSMDGIDILHKVKIMNKVFPKVIISSEVPNQYQIEKTIDAGADDYLIKPFDEDILFSKLKIMRLL